MKRTIQSLLALVVAAGSAWGGLQAFGHRCGKDNVVLAEALIRRDRVRTPNEKMTIVKASATPNGTACIEFTSEDARPESIRIERAVLDGGGLAYVSGDEYGEKCGTVAEDFTYAAE
jgi:hypothetical protein